MKEWEWADIQFEVVAESSEDSNLFLRKFYEELAQFSKVAWNFQSYREGKVIHVGHTNVGEMWFDYNERGKINKVYFNTYSEETHKNVELALNRAKKNHNDMKCYMLTVVFDTEDIMFCSMSKNGIKINSTEIEGKKLTSFVFPVYAFGIHDFEYVKTQKVNYLKQLLCAYTNTIFKCIGISYKEGMCSICNNDWKEPNEDWIDIEDEFIGVEERRMTLRTEFFELFKKVIDTSEYNRKMRLLLNSSQEIFLSKKMSNNLLQNGNEWNMPGYTDLINTLMVSALEPLSGIYGVEPERCNQCGNLKYSIRKKVRDLCNTYLPEHIAKDIYEKGYGQRSSFLHEGTPATNEFYCGYCVPLLNPVDGRSILFPTAYIDLNLFIYITFIFRKVVRKVLEEERTTNELF